MKKGVNDVLTRLLSEKLQSFNDKDLNLVACVEMFKTIFDTLIEVFQAAGVDISNEAMNYIAQQYYDGILINGTNELDPNIFTQRARLENIETRELALLAVMLNGSGFLPPIIQEIKKRS